MLARAIVSLLIGFSSLAAEPTAAELKQQAERCKRLLQESLVRFYLPGCLDHEYGGYHEILRDGHFTGNGEKFLTHQARQIWFFSTMAREGYERNDALAAAKHGFEFLHAKFRDTEHGGYFSKVTEAGEPKDPRKHAYLNSFALYALAAYYQTSGDPRALSAAQQLFGVLEARAHDAEHGGYIEFFERDWQPITDSNAPGYVGAIGHKTYNTHLHLLESYCELYRAWPDEKVRRRVAELISINISTVQFADVHANVDAFERNWKVVRTPRNLRASYGHDVECIWLVMDAARTIGIAPSTLLNWAAGLAEYSMEFGYDREHGGFYAGGPLGKPADDLKKTWWVQTEALLGMLEMYRLTKDSAYWEAFSKTLNFCEKHQIAEEGGWWATRAEDGSPTADKTRTGPWQAAYHAGRALIFGANWLNQLAEAR